MRPALRSAAILPVSPRHIVYMQRVGKGGGEETGWKMNQRLSKNGKKMCPRMANHACLHVSRRTSSNVSCAIPFPCPVWATNAFIPTEFCVVLRSRVTPNIYGHDRVARDRNRVADGRVSSQHRVHPLGMGSAAGLLGGRWPMRLAP